MESLLLIGLNHTTAPLELRERVTLDRKQQTRVESMLQRAGARESVILCTCNRTEFYLAADSGGMSTAVLEAIQTVRGVPAEQVASHLYIKTARDAIEHLFSVAAGLDSMVLGETQILGQLRDAYESARAEGRTGAVLNPLMQRAVAVARTARSSVPLGDPRVSVASVAVDYARQIFANFADKTVLTLGAGKMGRLVIDAFARLRPASLRVINRDPSRAASLAQAFGGTSASLEQLDRHLIDADILIASTGSDRPVITRARFEPLIRKRRYRPIFLIDIAMPRDIEPSVGELENVYLYNLDDLQNALRQSTGRQDQSLRLARQLVSDAADRYLDWHRQRELGPMIERLYERYHQLAREELDRTFAQLPDLAPAERAQLEDLARRLVNKLLHEPIRGLRQSDKHPPGLPYVHVVEKLFGLDDSSQRPSTRGESTPPDSD